MAQEMAQGQARSGNGAAARAKLINQQLVSQKKTPVNTQSQIEQQVRRFRRLRPGTAALREIKKFQRSSELLLARAPFQRLIREIAVKIDDQIRF
jgi:histone H3